MGKGASVERSGRLRGDEFANLGKRRLSGEDLNEKRKQGLVGAEPDGQTVRDACDRRDASGRLLAELDAPHVVAMQSGDVAELCLREASRATHYSDCSARALAAVIVRYLTTIQPHASRELARWRRRALAIPDPRVRAHVLHPYSADESAAGAALFAVLAPWRHQLVLVRLLVAYVLLWSYVDARTERDPHADPRLYDALLDGLREPLPADPFADDVYLAALLAASRCGCAALPSWATVAPTALQLADDGRAVQMINHGSAATAPARLRAWAEPRGGVWPEMCAAASSPLAIHALMALAAHPQVDPDDAASMAAAYGPVSALGVLCDHLIDATEDHAAGSHSYLRYVDSRDLIDLADRACRGVRQLDAGERHGVILAAMTAMFFSRPNASNTTEPHGGRGILEAIGPPAPQLRAVLRATHIRPPRAR